MEQIPKWRWVPGGGYPEPSGSGGGPRGGGGSLEPSAGGDWSPVMGMGDPGTACINVDWDCWLANVSLTHSDQLAERMVGWRGEERESVGGGGVTSCP